MRIAPYSIIVLLFISLTTIAQERVKMGVLYKEGERLQGPLSGVEATVPKGWQGIIPSDSELFALIPTDGSDGEMFIRVTQGDNYNVIKERWKQGLDMGGGIFAQLDGEITTRPENILSAKFNFSGGSGTYQGYIEAKCGAYGYCLLISAITTAENYQNYKGSLQTMMDGAVLNEPNPNFDVYEDFDWSEFLNNKYLVTYESHVKYKKQNNLWLCGNGTFQSNLARRGMAKSDKNPVTGKKKGTWEAKGVGSQGELLLNFKGIEEPLKVLLRIEEDKVYLTGERYFVMEEQKKCK